MTTGVIRFTARARDICINAAPVVAREFRMESRRPVNYWLRVFAAGVLIFVFASFISTSQLDGSRIGWALFSLLHRTLMLGFWIVAPLFTADCISKEKREGTLGLLFLTPLTVLDVILGKSAIHIFRACTLFVAVTPILGLPFVLGGVSWMQGIIALVQVGSAALLGIAAGVYASAKGGTTIQVMVMAELYAAGLAFLWWLSNLLLFRTAFALGLRLSVIPFSIGIMVLSLLLFGLVVRESVKRLNETWDQDSSASERPRWTEMFSNSEFWRDIFYWDKSRTLDRNPMAWLQEYSWTARLTKWGWFLLFLFADLVVMTDWESRLFIRWLPGLTGALALGVAFSAAGSFRREKQTGLLEILLVTPISTRKVIAGRLWGMLCNYFPALLALIVCWQGMRLLNSHARSGFFALVFPNPLSFAALMVLGLYLSMTRLNFLLGWFLTWLVAFILPALATIALGKFAGIEASTATLLASVLQICIAISMWFLLERVMNSRSFVSESSINT